MRRSTSEPPESTISLQRRWASETPPSPSLNSALSSSLDTLIVPTPVSLDSVMLLRHDSTPCPTTSEVERTESTTAATKAPDRCSTERSEGVVDESMSPMRALLSIDLPAVHPPSPPPPCRDTNIVDSSTITSVPSQTSSTPEAKTEDVTAPGISRPSEIPGTSRGMCMICLEDCEDVLGPDWLHRPRKMLSPGAEEVEEEKKAEFERCTALACVACLKAYFTGIVETGFDGACPRMRCICCPRVVCERVWARLVEPDVVKTFQRRASMLLSIQCGECHSRGTVMVVPPVDHSYSSALEKMMAEVDKALDGATAGTGAGNVGSIEDDPAGAKTTANATAYASADSTGTGNGSHNESFRSSGHRAEIKETFRAALTRYTSGDEIDASPCYMALERVFSTPKLSDMKQSVRDDLVRLLFSCVDDSERRANLHIRFIRSNPMVITTCCHGLHCYRCRVYGGHAPLTCEQYEAKRGPEKLCKCPGCGVYVVKGDGCDSITCICGYNFDWSELVRGREMMEANVFRDTHPEDTGRAAVEIIRRGLPAHADAADAQQEIYDREPVGTETTGTISEVQEEYERVLGGAGLQPFEDLGRPPEDGWGPEPGEAHGRPLEDGWGPELGEEPNSGGAERNVEIAEVSEGNRPFSAEDEFRLALAYTDAYPREAAQAHALVYGEENPHFTVQRARAQSNPESWQSHGLFLSRYTGRPRAHVPDISETEATWQTNAARAWLTHNQISVRAVERTEEAARLSRVEAFYGWGGTPQGHNTAISHMAAEHARAALRVAAPGAGATTITAAIATAATAGKAPRPSAQRERSESSEENEPLFKWLGIVEPPRPTFPARDGRAVGSSSADADNSSLEGGEEKEEWVMPFAGVELELEHTSAEIIPHPSVLWTPWPTGRIARASTMCPRRMKGRLARPADPRARRVSAVEAFGMAQIGLDVQRWLAGSDTRQRELRRLMATEEDNLAKAWVALWGRRLCLGSATKTWVDGTAKDDNTAIRAAARRVVFLEAHPEQACREQAPMMKAFVRRYGGAVIEAREKATADLAAEWEQMQVADGVDGPSSKTAVTAARFDRAYDAYARHLETAPGSSDVTGSSDFQLRRTHRLASAWEAYNHRRVCARRFADRFSGDAATDVDVMDAAQEEKSASRAPEGVGADSGMGGRTATAASAAVVALVVVPMLFERTSQMCDCELKGTISDAADWVSLNKAAFEAEVESMEARLSRTEGREGGTAAVGRAIEGCECGYEEEESPSMSCARLVACPVTTRRYLEASEPACGCSRVDDGLCDGDLFGLFS